jgi:hypothetical protein
VLAVTSTAFAVAGADVAQAGGTPQASCPSGIRTDIKSLDTPPLGKPVQVQAGFYGETGSFWPPFTVIACRTKPAPGHPVVKRGGLTCTHGGVPFQIPDFTPSSFSASPPVTWGTHLPRGWYYLAGTGGGWATVCWSAHQPVLPAPTTGGATTT